MTCYDVTIGESEHRVDIRRDGERYILTIDAGEELAVSITRPQSDVLSLLLDGRSWDAGVTEHGEGFEVQVLGVPHQVDVVDPRRKALAVSGTASEDNLRTQMPGRIVRVLVSEGESVTRGSPLVVIEAMKMENELCAPRDGIVRRIAVTEGELVEARAVLIELGD